MPRSTTGPTSYSSYHVQTRVPYDVVEKALEGKHLPVDWLYYAPSAEASYRSQIMFRLNKPKPKAAIKEFVLKCLAVPYDDRLVPWLRVLKSPALYAQNWRDEMESNGVKYGVCGRQPWKRPQSYYDTKILRQVKTLHALDTKPPGESIQDLNMLLMQYPLLRQSLAMLKFEPYIHRFNWVYDPLSKKYYETEDVMKAILGAPGQRENLEETQTEIDPDE